MAKVNDRPKTNTAKQQKTLRHIKVGRSSYRPFKREIYPRAIPWIQMKGHWLVEAGFTIDAQVNIQVKAGCLVLTAE